MEREFLDALVCPKCLSALEFNENENQLICAQDKLIYPIEDNIPILLETMALSLDTKEIIT